VIDRVEVNRSLAKAIAFKAVGKDYEARQWAAKLVRQLECAEILIPDYVAGVGSVADDSCPDHPPGVGVIGCTGCFRR